MSAVLTTTVEGSALVGCQRFATPVTLSYAPHRPWEVVLTFVGAGTGGVDVPWTFARDLLEDGLSTPSGEGAVRVAPDADEHTVTVRLQTGSGAGVVVLPWDGVADFLDATFELVPGGTEQSSWDAALVDLLTGATDG